MGYEKSQLVKAKADFEAAAALIELAIENEDEENSLVLQALDCSDDAYDHFHLKGPRDE